MAPSRPRTVDWLRGSLRLLAPMLGALALLWVLALVTFHAGRDIHAANATVIAAQDRMLMLSEIRSLSRSLQRDVLNLITESDEGERRTITGKVLTRSQTMQHDLTQLERTPHRGGLPRAYFTSSYHVVEALRGAAARAGAQDRSGALRDFQSIVRPAERAASTVADAQVEALRTRVVALGAAAEATEWRAARSFVVAVLTLTLTGLAAGLLITQRGLILPLRSLQASMRNIASGETTQTIPHLDRADEIGQVAQSLAELRRQLDRADEAKRIQARQIVDGLGRALDALAQGDLTARVDDDLAGEFAKLKADCNTAVFALAQTLHVVRGSAGEIAGRAGAILAASDALAGRTEQQATAIEQTAAAIHQITQTVRDTAQSAKRAEALVGVARDDADTLDAVIRALIAAMATIDRSSAEIAEIIGVIDDFTFQTSLLSLNAGIEAARAGDAGRGFAVIAGEVRLLAQRSAEASQEVKGRVSASVRQIDTGVALAGEAGQGLDRIRASMIRAAELVATITHANGEQAVGLGEINEAVTQMDTMTQRNAAMVEEFAAAARLLDRLSGTMVEQIARFRLADQTRPASAALIMRTS